MYRREHHSPTGLFLFLFFLLDRVYDESNGRSCVEEDPCVNFQVVATCMLDETACEN